EMAIVTANCWYSLPVIPGMNAVGMKTAESTSAMPITGPEISSIARNAASFGARPSSMWRSTASTTTIASSTTSPIASTSPNSESVLMLKPREENEGPDQRYRHREQRDQRGPPSLQEQIYDGDHQND